MSEPPLYTWRTSSKWIGVWLQTVLWLQSGSVIVNCAAMVDQLDAYQCAHPVFPCSMIPESWNEIDKIAFSEM